MNQKKWKLFILIGALFTQLLNTILIPKIAYALEFKGELPPISFDYQNEWICYPQGNVGLSSRDDRSWAPVTFGNTKSFLIYQNESGKYFYDYGFGEDELIPIHKDSSGLKSVAITGNSYSLVFNPVKNTFVKTEYGSWVAFGGYKDALKLIAGFCRKT